jgi:hypothetical protein
MLAISAQGLMYYFGVSIFGINFFGLAVAVLLSSVWAFFQSILFVYLVFGSHSINVADFYLKEFEKVLPNAGNYLLWAMSFFILLKWLTALILSVLAIRLSDVDFDKFHKKMIMQVKPPKEEVKHSALYLALKDTLSPLFIISFLLTAIFFFLSQSSQSTVQIVWLLLRPLAIGFILFYIVRVYPMKNLSKYLDKKGFAQTARILDIATKAVQNLRGL